MIGDRDLQIKRDLNSTTWLTDIIWAAAQKQQLASYFRPDRVQIEDDHLPFMDAGVPSVDIIDLEYPAWHTAADTLDAVSARSLQVVGDALVAALPQIEARLQVGSASGSRLRRGFGRRNPVAALSASDSRPPTSSLSPSQSHLNSPRSTASPIAL